LLDDEEVARRARVATGTILDAVRRAGRGPPAGRANGNIL